MVVLVEIKIIRRPENWTAFRVRIWSAGAAAGIEQLLAQCDSGGPIQALDKINYWTKKMIVANHILAMINREFHLNRLQNWNSARHRWEAVSPSYRALIESFTPCTVVHVRTENMCEGDGLTLVL